MRRIPPHPHVVRMPAVFRSQNAYTSYLNYLPLRDVQAHVATALALPWSNAGVRRRAACVRRRLRQGERHLVRGPRNGNYVRCEGWYEVLLIDLDGTVVDYAQTEAAALAVVHVEFFSERASFGEFAAEFQAGNDGLWAAYREGGLSLDDLRSERSARLLAAMPGTAPLPAVTARFEAEPGRRVTLFPDARPALRALRRLARLVLVTDGIAPCSTPSSARAGCAASSSGW
jgi:hypothetical protein